MSNTAYSALFMDAGLNHSSAYFTSPDATLDVAQQAKIYAILDRCQLSSSTRLLDIGCGWGNAARVAATEYQADVVGITLDPEQADYALRKEADRPAASRVDFRVQRWEEFTEPVDRIICINAFENFEDKLSFLPHCRSIMPRGGIVVILTVTADRRMFRVVSKKEVISSGETAGFKVNVSESLASHYIRTLDCFVDNIRKHRERAVDLVGEDRVNRTTKFYTEGARYLRSGLNDLFEFTFTAR